MKNKMIILLLMFVSLLHGQEIDQEDIVAFNTQHVIFHQPIQTLLKASHEELLAEPSMKQATVDFAWEMGGPITRDILTKFREILSEEDYKSMRIDTKVQIIDKNDYSNTPGWHCDFFSTSDEQEDRLVRLNPGLEASTRLFLILSGEPATEFMIPRHFNVDVNVHSWKQISQYIDSMISSEDLYRIPVATPVELTGNELHRVTIYEGEEPTVRYFMRIYLFPKGHSQYGIYRNELYNWETHPEITTILGDVHEFLDKAFSHLNEAGVDVSRYEMTHLCYRVATEREFQSKKEELLKVGTLISEVLAEGRPYLVFKLDHPIDHLKHTVSLIALPCPKPNNLYSTGLQHVAFLIKENLSTLLNLYPQIEFDTLELNRTSHPELKLRFAELVVKFHNLTLEDLAQQAGATQP